MRNLIFILCFLGLSLSAQSQFTAIPTGTTARIRDIALHGDTLIISGVSSTGVNYFAKSYDMGNSIVPFIPPGLSGYYNDKFQVVDNNYYILSLRGLPYFDAFILKSVDYGDSWDSLYYTSGQFYSLAILDTAFGVMGGSFGSYSMTVGSDTAWVLQDSLYSIIMEAKAYGDSTMIMLSTGGSAYITHNRGQTWDWGYCNNAEHTAIQFINEDTIYSVGFEGAAPKADFSYSYDGGYHFFETMIGHNDSTNQYEYYAKVYDLFFKNAKDGYLIGHTVGGGTIFQTNDYGQTFTPYLTGFNEEFYSLLNVNDSIAFIGGDNGLLLKWNKNVPLTTVLNIKDLEASQIVHVFPNPFTETTTFNFQDIQLPAILQVYDRLGRIVRTESIQSAKHLFRSNEMNAGMYYYQIGSLTGKIIINR